MPEEDYQSLLESVEKDGFKDPIIRLLGTEVLDGWHRYRAAKELNLIRKLRFHQWDKKDEGDPSAFVKARNLERRHLSKAQRGQIVVHFNTRAGAGNPNQLHQNDEVKTRDQLAKEAGVSTATIDRAAVIENAGESQAVIRGEKTAAEVLKEQKEAKLAEERDRAEQAYDKMWEAYDKSELPNHIDADDFVKAACAAHINWGVEDIPDPQETDIPSVWESRFDLLTTLINMSITPAWIKELISETPLEEGVDQDASEVSVSDLWDKIEKNTAAIRNAYTEVYQKGAVSVSEMFTAGIHYYNLPKEGLELSLDNPTGGYEDKKRLTRIERVTARMLSDFTESRVKAGWIRKCLSGEAAEKSASARESQAEGNGLVHRQRNEQDPDFSEKLKMLWEQIAEAISAWKSDRKGQGVGHASKGMFLAATKRFHDLPRKRETDVDLLEKLLSLLSEVHGTVYTFERYIEMQCNGADIWEESDAEEPTPDHTEKLDALVKFKNQKSDLYALINATPLISVKDEFGNENADKARHRVMVAAHKAYDVSEDLLWSDPAIEALSAEEIQRITGQYFLMVQDFADPRADWVTALYKEAGIPESPAELSFELVDSPSTTIQDVIPGVKVLSIKLVLSGHEDVWFEDDSRAPNAIPLSAVPEDVLVQLLMLTQDTKRLDAAAGEFVKVFNAKVDELRLRDFMILDTLKKACTYHSCVLENLLMLTNLFPDQFDEVDAKAYRERMVAQDINAWINTLKSMKRDVEAGENWMSGLS